LGALTKIPHGLTVSLASVPVLRHTIPEGAPALQEWWIDVCGKKASDDAVTDATAFVDFLDAFIASTGLPRTVNVVA
jgi:alcohol dehydrogenase class IV